MGISMSVTINPDMKRSNDKLRRRSQRRQHFTASALVLEPKSETLLRARTADLGADGCFIDTLNPFATGTAVKVRIEKSGACFEAWARVVYSLESMGMGLAFHPVGPEQLWVLHEWLGDASGVLAPEVSLPAIEGEPAVKLQATEARKQDLLCEALNDLVQDFMARGLISGDKGQAILQKLGRCSESE